MWAIQFKVKLWFVQPQKVKNKYYGSCERNPDSLNIKKSPYVDLGFNDFDKICPESRTPHCKSIIDKAKVGLF